MVHKTFDKIRKVSFVTYDFSPAWIKMVLQDELKAKKIKVKGNL
jgi:c-di-GMP-binding flagellar brake protein YcgR